MSAIYERENVKVNVEAIRTVRALVRILKFYKDEEGNPRSDEEKTVLLLSLNDALSQVYELEPPTLHVDGTNCCYVPVLVAIHLNKPSIMSFLHEYRHFLQHNADKMFVGLSVEEDARSWSMRCFSKASPGNFLNSVKAGKIIYLKWDEENQCVVDDLEAIELNDTDDAEARLRIAFAGFNARAQLEDIPTNVLEANMMDRIAALGEDEVTADDIIYEDEEEEVE